MPWLALLAFALGWACGMAVARVRAARQRPRLTYYGRHQLTGSEARQRLFK
jgi:hypothetical protein